MTPDTSTPSWAIPGSRNKYGWVTCAKCGSRVSSHSVACRCCCKHEEVALYESEDNGGNACVQTVCLICGDTYLNPKFILENFELVRRKKSN